MAQPMPENNVWEFIKLILSGGLPRRGPERWCDVCKGLMCIISLRKSSIIYDYFTQEIGGYRGFLGRRPQGRQKATLEDKIRHLRLSHLNQAYKIDLPRAPPDNAPVSDVFLGGRNSSRVDDVYQPGGSIILIKDDFLSNFLIMVNCQLCQVREVPVLSLAM